MPSARAVSEDFKCIINTYCDNRQYKKSEVDPENNMECPLTELGLISYVTSVQGVRIFRKSAPKIDILPELIVMYAILKQVGSDKEIKISQLQNAANGVGKIFLLDTLSLLQILYKLEARGFIKVVRTAGLDVIQVLTDYTPEDCVKQYYEELNEN